MNVFLPSISTLVAMLVAVVLTLALTRRVWTSVIATLYLLAAVLICSLVKQAHLGVALTLADVNFFFLRPAENFKLFINYPKLGAALVLLIAGWAVCVWVGLHRERVNAWMSKFSSPWWRIAMACAALVVMGSSFTISKVLARANDGDAYAAFLAMYEMQNVHGPMMRLNVFFNNRSMEANVPEPRQQHRFITKAALVNTALTNTTSENTASVQAAASTLQPDIFLVLEESTFDPMLITHCPAPLCDDEFLHPLAAATRIQQGPLLVHTTGGGTWLAEFAVLSGFDWRVFGRGGAYAPVSLAPRLQHSLPRYLRSLGYRTIAIYPTDGNFLSAKLAYDEYGFDEFYDRRDLGLPDDWPQISDRMVFGKALQVIAKHDDKPVFAFVLTIRNHGPHGANSKNIPTEFAVLSNPLSPGMADFLARMHDSSRQYIELSKTWLLSPRPRVLAWFGDHQPEAAWDFTGDAAQLNSKRLATNATFALSKYQTFYQFAANYGAAHQQLDVGALDISYLGATLLDFAGLALDENFSTTHTMATMCNGLMLDCADREAINDYLSYRIHELQSVR